MLLTRNSPHLLAQPESEATDQDQGIPSPVELNMKKSCFYQISNQCTEKRPGKSLCKIKGSTSKRKSICKYICTQCQSTQIPKANINPLTGRWALYYHGVGGSFVTHSHKCREHLDNERRNRVKVYLRPTEPSQPLENLACLSCRAQKLLHSKWNLFQGRACGS